MLATTKGLVISTPGCSSKCPSEEYLWGYCFIYILSKKADVICMGHQALNYKILSVIQYPLK